MKRKEPLIEWCDEGDGLRFTKRGLWIVVPIEIGLLIFALWCVSQP